MNDDDKVVLVLILLMSIIATVAIYKDLKQMEYKHQLEMKK